MTRERLTLLAWHRLLEDVVVRENASRTDVSVDGASYRTPAGAAGDLVDSARGGISVSVLEVRRGLSASTARRSPSPRPYRTGTAFYIPPSDVGSDPAPWSCQVG